MATLPRPTGTATTTQVAQRLAAFSQNPIASNPGGQNTFDAVAPTTAPTTFDQYLNSGNTDVWAYVQTLLGDLGLGDLNSWAQNKLVEYGSDFSDDLFLQQIREQESYKKRFKAIEIAKKNGQPIPTEAEVIALEKGYAQIAQQAGLPSGFYDSADDFANLIGRGVSVNEYQTRILDGYTAVRNDPTIQNQLSRLYELGANDGDLVAFYLDPDRATSAIQLRQSAATIASRGAQSGFGNITKDAAERLAGQGISESQARQGFGQLSDQAGLFSTVGSETSAIDQETGLAATFENNAAALDAINRRRNERNSKFSGGGGFSQNNRGATGAGSAS